MSKVKVSLREKKISKCRSSLYLDFYPAIFNAKSGKRTRRQFLGKYISSKPKTLFDKQHNQETLEIAEKIRQMKQNQLDKPEIYTDFEREQLKYKENGDRSFVTYFKQLADKRKGSTYDNWIATTHYLENYTGGNLRFSEINEEWCNGFKNYLLKVPSRKSSKVSLSPNSALSYFNKVTATLKQAFKEGILQIDIGRRIDPIKYVETHRQYLNVNELRALIQTECPLPPVWRKASIFSALTGMRFSDIQKLRWSEVQFTESNGHIIEYIQQKTDSAEILQISEQAYDLLGDRQQGMEMVFQGLHYSAYNNNLLRKWVINAGIFKHISFHCFRHYGKF